MCSERKAAQQLKNLNYQLDFISFLSASGSGSATGCATNIEELETLYVEDKKLIVMKRDADSAGKDAFDFIQAKPKNERKKLFEEGFKNSDKMVRTHVWRTSNMICCVGYYEYNSN